MQSGKLSRFLVRNSGKESLKKKIRRNECHIPYLSKAEYDDLKDPQLIGYTLVKRGRTEIVEDDVRNTENIIGLLDYVGSDQPFLNESISVIRKKKHKFKTIKGYFDVGNNQYVAIEKNNPFLFLIPLLLILLIIGLCASCGAFNNDDPIPVDPWQPTIEENLGDSPTNLFEQRNIEISGFSAWHVPADETESIPITLKNPEGNPCYFSFVITLEDSGEELYHSAMVKPGDTIKSININRPLESGQYNVLIQILTNELDTGKAMNDACFEVALTVD